MKKVIVGLLFVLMCNVGVQAQECMDWSGSGFMRNTVTPQIVKRTCDSIKNSKDGSTCEFKVLNKHTFQITRTMSLSSGGKSIIAQTVTTIKTDTKNIVEVVGVRFKFMELSLDVSVSPEVKSIIQGALMQEVTKMQSLGMTLRDTSNSVFLVREYQNEWQSMEISRFDPLDSKAKAQDNVFYITYKRQSTPDYMKDRFNSLIGRSKL